MSQLLPSLQFLEALLTDVMLDPAGFLFRSGILYACFFQYSTRMTYTVFLLKFNRADYSLFFFQEPPALQRFFFSIAGQIQV